MHTVFNVVVGIGLYGRAWCCMVNVRNAREVCIVNVVVCYDMVLCGHVMHKCYTCCCCLWGCCLQYGLLLCCMMWCSV